MPRAINRHVAYPQESLGCRVKVLLQGHAGVSSLKDEIRSGDTHQRAYLLMSESVPRCSWVKDR